MIKVIHILGTLDRGGVETWLKRLVYKIDMSEYQFDFCCLGDREGAYANELKNMGSKIFVLNLNRGIIRFSKEFYLLLKKEKYDVVHSHVHFFSGYLAFLSRFAGTKIFITHSHNTSDGHPTSIKRIAYRMVMRWMIYHFSKEQVAASTEAAKHLFVKRAIKSEKVSLIRCGIDVNNKREYYYNNKNICPVLEKVENPLILGNIARFHTQKNHEFLIEIMKEIIQFNKNIFLVLVGDGPLKPRIREKALSLGLGENIIFLGNIDNASKLLDFFDIFVMPSLYEGLPVAALEAQAAGVPVILSDSISKETAVVDELVTFLPLAKGARIWAEEIIKLAKLKPKIDLDIIRSRFEKKDFSLDASLRELKRIYNKGKDKL